MNKTQAKEALDSIIKKSRVHLYKPIQIAEILYRKRINPEMDLLDLESYRTKSKKWRDAVSLELLGRICTSSARFQDNLFDNNAIPPNVLYVLGEENNKTGGAIEAYIYSRFENKLSQLSNALTYCIDARKDTFNVTTFIESFRNEPGLKRSLDKVYEIIVYALFCTIIDQLALTVEISINKDKIDVLKEFEDFAKGVMCLDLTQPFSKQNAKIYRVGVTNAADRGLDMYSNWGPAIQVKHLSLDEELAENIVDSVSADRIIIVCKTAEKKVILSLLAQIGWKARIQDVITENDLVRWYEKALHGKYSDQMGDMLLHYLTEEIQNEFPSVGENTGGILADRRYEKIKNSFWK